MADKAALGRHISGGRPLQPGEHSPVTKIGKRRRNEFLRRAAAAFYSRHNVPSHTPGEFYTRPSPIPWQASQLSRDFENYFTRGAWRFDRDAKTCRRPIAHVSTDDAKAFIAARTPLAAVRARLADKAAAEADELSVIATAPPAGAQEQAVAEAWDEVVTNQNATLPSQKMK